MERKQVLSDNWERGDSYEQYVGRWSRRVAPLFVQWLRVPENRNWLDVGCGTGALCAAILDYGSPSSVLGIEPSEGFLNQARENLEGRVTLHRSSATEIPLDESAVDAAVSGLVLNFVADPPAALAEMARVTVSGGTVGAYVWDYAGKMEFMRIFWDAAVELNPEAVGLDEGVRFRLCRPEPLVELFTQAGLKAIEVVPIEIPTHFANFDDYWRPFLGGQGPAPGYTLSLDEAARARLQESLRRRIRVQTDQSIHLTARAWAIRANVVK